jgi:hypothetical protein
MKNNEKMDVFKARFSEKLRLAGRDRIAGGNSQDLFQKDQLIWFKKSLNKKWRLVCSSQSIRSLESWRDVADELISMEKEETLFIQAEKNSLKCFTCGKIGHISKDCWKKNSSASTKIDDEKKRGFKMLKKIPRKL